MRKTIKGSKKIITRMTAFVLSLILLFGWEIGSYADGFDAETVIAEPVIEAQDEAEEETSAVVTQTTLTSEPEVANDETDTEAGTEVRTITDEPTATLSAPSSDTTITDEKTALASGKTEKRFNIKNYLWILLLIATTVVASLLYAYYTKKEEEEEASENW